MNRLLYYLSFFYLIIHLFSCTSSDSENNNPSSNCDLDTNVVGTFLETENVKYLPVITDLPTCQFVNQYNALVCVHGFDTAIQEFDGIKTDNFAVIFWNQLSAESGKYPIAYNIELWERQDYLAFQNDEVTLFFGDRDEWVANDGEVSIDYDPESKLISVCFDKIRFVDHMLDINDQLLLGETKRITGRFTFLVLWIVVFI